MHLFDEFPHTRREQYLVALPEALLTDEEVQVSGDVIRRYMRWLPFWRMSFLVGLRADGWSMDEILGLLGQPPAAFCLPEPDQ